MSVLCTHIPMYTQPRAHIYIIPCICNLVYIYTQEQNKTIIEIIECENKLSRVFFNAWLVRVYCVHTIPCTCNLVYTCTQEKETNKKKGNKCENILSHVFFLIIFLACVSVSCIHDPIYIQSHVHTITCTYNPVYTYRQEQTKKQIKKKVMSVKIN
jgi:hypothetical protein